MFSARSVSLFAVLYGVWLLLSGIWEPFFLISGAVASLLVVIVAQRMDVIDGEGHPVQLSWRALTYFPWLFWQIIKSNIDVARRIVSPRLPIEPADGWVEASQKSTAGLVTFANSITLTPGTVSMTVHEDRIHVHALSKAGFDDLKEGEMNRRVTQMEGRR
ncbi:MAG: Na+/H+ antiporter subunit E [Pseudomonadota bacterium]